MIRHGSNCAACRRYNPTFADSCAGCGGEGPRARRLRLQAEGDEMIGPLLRHFEALTGDIEKTSSSMNGNSRAKRARAMRAA
jgi:hypothetical protein